MLRFIVLGALFLIIKVVIVKCDLDIEYPSSLQLLSAQDLIKNNPHRHQPVYESPSVWTYDGISIKMPDKVADIEEAYEEDYNYEEEYEEGEEKAENEGDNQSFNSTIASNIDLSASNFKRNKNDRKNESKEKSNDTHSYLIIDQPLINVTRPSGQRLKLVCSFKGHPKPSIKWFKNEAMVEQIKGKTSIRVRSNQKDRFTSRLSINDVDIHDTGYYKCEASNSHKSLETVGILIVESDSKSKENQLPIIPDYSHRFSESVNLQYISNVRKPSISINQSRIACTMYHGAICSQFFGNKSIYIKDGTNQNELEANLKVVFNMIANSYQVSPQCHRYVIPFLCFSTFPRCEDNLSPLLQLSSSAASPSPTPILKKICRDECEILENEICRKEYLIERELNPFNNKIMPECKLLPVVGSPNHQQCIKLGVPSSAELDESQVCYEGQGRSYRGTASRSVTGKSCIPWSSVYDTAGHSELIGGHNFCRNPDRLEAKPWCFVNEKIKEVCDLSQCSRPFWIHYMLIPSMVALLFILSFFSFCFFRKWSNEKLKQNSNLDIAVSYKSCTVSNDSGKLSSHKYASCDLGRYSYKLSTLNHFSEKCIKIHEKLCEGDFGDIYTGDVLIPQGVVIPVAIRTLRMSSNSNAIQNFKSEANLLSSLQHPNIVCLIGVCFSDFFMAMLFEYVCESNLLQFLIKYSPKRDKIDGKQVNVNYLKILDLLHIAIQIAAGIEYLSNNHYTHRDLAARNCLISDYMMVKISNFKLNREDYSSDYYCIPNNQSLPVRWLPPESIFYEKFTTSSDVWSFGVVLWEIFSFGKQPYFGYTNQQVIELIKDHHLLPCPEDCPPHIYSLMIDCWRNEPSNRPNFVEIHNKLKAWQAVENVRSTKATFRKFSSHNLDLYSSRTEQTSSESSQTITPKLANKPNSRYNKRNLIFSKEINSKVFNLDKSLFDLI